MPGLIDSHVHLGFEGGPDPDARMRTETDEQQLVLMLENSILPCPRMPARQPGRHPP